MDRKGASWISPPLAYHPSKTGEHLVICMQPSPVKWRRCFCGQMDKLHISTLGSSNPTSHMEVFLGALHGFIDLKHDCQDNATSTGATNFQTSGGEVVTDRQLLHFRDNHNPTTSQPSINPSSLRGVGNHHFHHHPHHLHPFSTTTTTSYLLLC